MVTVKEKFHFKIRRDRFQRNAVRTVKYFIRLSCEHSRRGQTKQEPVDKARLPATVVGNEPTLTPPPGGASEGPDTLRPCSSVWEHARGLYHRCLLSVLSVNIYRVEGIEED